MPLPLRKMNPEKVTHNINANAKLGPVYCVEAGARDVDACVMA